MTRKLNAPTEQRWGRSFDDLLRELEVVQTGNQLLFAFLLTAAFTDRFASISPFQRGVYIGILLLSTVGTSLIVAPTGLHRLNYRHNAKGTFMRTASRLTTLALTFVVLEMSGALFLAVDLVAGRVIAIIAVSVSLLVHIGLWYLTPATWRRLR